MRIGGLHHREIEGGGEGKKIEDEMVKGDEKEYYIRDEGIREKIN